MDLTKEADLDQLEGQIHNNQGEGATEQSHQIPQHHNVFYLSGKAVVFKVQDTLFKVDPTLFTGGEESAFKSMLRLPQGDGHLQEGTDDSSPIILQGDTSSQFEYLIWGLQSQKLSPAKVADDDIERFIQMARISHKYDLQTLETWAVSGLDRLAQRNDVTRRAQAASLLEIFSFCNRVDAVQLMVSTIETMLKEKVCSTTEITTFINLGHKLNLKRLVGLGYYTMMLKPREEWEAEPSFSPTQRYRLLSGYYTLAEYPIERAIQALGKEFEIALDDWNIPDYWKAFAVPSKEAALRSANKIKVADVAGRLRCLVEAFLDSGWDSQAVTFRSSLENMIDRLIENEFHDFFRPPMPHQEQSSPKDHLLITNV